METQSGIDYATWSGPDLPITIRYALPAFYEIEFLVSEGFRRIPYGGIEHGGLLFGKRAGDEIRIDAFRPIECEHASGPGFLLSARDVEGVKAQIAAAASDSELRDLVPLGIFISHSRRELQATDEDHQILETVVPQPGKLLLLVKPEKFKPTRFVFIGQGIDPASFILPPLTRQERKPAARPSAEEPLAEQPKAPPAKAKRTRRKAHEILTAAHPAVETPPVLEAEPPPTTQQISEQPVTRRLHPRQLAVLAGALLVLGMCWVYFYWNFLEPPIELQATVTPAGLIVSWTADATAGAGFAALQVWRGSKSQTMYLSTADKQAGHAIVSPAPNDVTVELVVHRRWHDRRGAIRVIMGE